VSFSLFLPSFNNIFVTHKDKWPTELANLLLQETDGTGKIDVVIDSGGGDQLMVQVGKVLKTGGRVVCYGM